LASSFIIYILVEEDMSTRKTYIQIVLSKIEYDV